MLVLSALTSLVPTIIFVGPTVFIPMMMEDLNITTAEAGIIVTIVLLGAGLTGTLGGPLMSKFGIKHTRTIALVFYTIGGLVPLFTSSFTVLLLSRILIGVGMGIAAGTSVGVTMDWYPPKERPLINSLNSILSLAGSFLALVLAIPVYNLVGGDWKMTLELFGVVMLITTILWMIFAKNNVQAKTTAPVGVDADPSNVRPKESVLKQVLRRKEVILLIVAYLSFMLASQSLQTFLPTFYQTDLQMSAAKSGTITSLISLASVVAGVLVGVLMAASGRRKIFMWPLLVLLLIGCVGSVTLPDGWMLYASVILIGLALNGWLPAMFTSVMELEGMTPEKAGAAQGVILSVGMFGGAVSTLVIGIIAEHTGLRNALLYFSFLAVFAIIATLIFPETGPKAKRNKVTIQ
ncbi:MFS transporter [Paenibacillus sp. ACRRY]|uniref:MFS transporter n=1 Tax=Paenibacillus sp. ACRRY TaxID=2918208 RepID=UPI0023B84DC1|nr:MFS transporter [Paenibacillus sp. ACRRY]